MRRDSSKTNLVIRGKLYHFGILQYLLCASQTNNHILSKSSHKHLTEETEAERESGREIEIKIKKRQRQIQTDRES